MRPQYLIYALFLGIFLQFPIFSIAQENQLYNGPYQLEKYKGEATYRYTLVDNDTVFNGIFKLQSSNLEALLEKKDTSFSINGKFENNIPTGYWTFRFNEFQSNSKSKVEDFQYVVSVSGTQKVIMGFLKNGKPDGIWTFSVQEIQNSQITNTTFQSTIEFDTGVPEKSFTIKNKEQELIGRFLRNGLAHDEWTLYSDNDVDAIESWIFNEGVLENIKLKTDTGITTIDVHTKSTEDTKTIFLNPKYLDILKLKFPNDDITKVAERGIISLLTINDINYQNINSILSEISEDSFSPRIRVRVPFLPLSTGEKAYLETITLLYAKSKSISDSLLTNTQLSLLKLSDKKVQSLEESVEDVSNRILIPLGSVVEYYENDMLSFISRNELLSNLWPEGVPNIQNIRNKKSSIPEDQPLQDSYSLDKLQSLSLESFNYLDSIQNILSKKITKQEREQEAINLEKKMIAEVQYLEKLKVSLQVDSIPVVFANTIEKIKKNAADKLSTYSDIKNTKDKLDYARELVNCFEKLDQVGEVIAHIPTQQYEIQSTYQEAIWNPFTATIMDESIKKRLVAAYENVLIPYFLKEIENGLSCDDTTMWINLVNATYDRMLALREMDTRKLERRLRKEEDPLIVLGRIGIQPQNKEN